MSASTPRTPEPYPVLTASALRSCRRAYSSEQEFTATISAFDIHPFTTDSQQTWLSQLPPQPPLAPPSSSLAPSFAPAQDFVLYDDDDARHQHQQQQLPRQALPPATARALATPSTALNHPDRRRSLSFQQQHSLQQQQQQQKTFSPLQNPRVRQSLSVSSASPVVSPTCAASKTSSPPSRSGYSLNSNNSPNNSFTATSLEYARAAARSSQLQYHHPQLLQQQQQQQLRSSNFPSPAADLTQILPSSPRPPVPLFGSPGSADQLHSHHQAPSATALAAAMALLGADLAPEAPLFDSYQSQGTLAFCSSSSSPTSLTSSTPDLHDVLTDDHIAAINHQRDLALFDHSFDSSSSEDLFSSMRHSAATPQTVSPEELLLDTSNPPSAALTNLSTPGMGFDEVSPFQHPDSMLGTPGSGDPLTLGEFDEDGRRSTSCFFAPLPGSSGLGIELPSRNLTPAVQPQHTPMTRTLSAEETFVPRSHSGISGVKSRSRSKPLPAIKPDICDDPQTAKRKRNTLAARKSREKKTGLLSKLDGDVKYLEGVVDHWQGRAERAEKEVQRLNELLQSLGVHVAMEG